jgi:hypothetical protein
MLGRGFRYLSMFSSEMSSFRSSCRIVCIIFYSSSRFREALHRELEATNCSSKVNPLLPDIYSLRPGWSCLNSNRRYLFMSIPTFISATLNSKAKSLGNIYVYRVLRKIEVAEYIQSAFNTTRKGQSHGTLLFRSYKAEA